MILLPQGEKLLLGVERDTLSTKKILVNLLAIRNAYPICAWQENELIAGLTDDLMALW
jgi:hypothetical protein